MTRPSARVEGIDVARGVAGLVMIFGHATHAWVTPEDKATAGYAVTRLFGTLPLPAFLVLAGAAVMWRVDAAARRGEDAADVRRRVAWRGIQIVLYGYAVSAIYALMDGTSGIDGLLRADVLHVIGLSIAVTAWLGIRPSVRSGRPPDPRNLLVTSITLGVLVTLACPWLTRLAPGTPTPVRHLVGLFADVPGVTLMPFVPLSAWLCAGVAAAAVMLRTRASSPAGAPTRTLLGLGAIGLACAVTASALTPEGVTRADLGVWLNVIDLAGRGVIVLAAGALLTRVVRGHVRAALLRMGRGSLVAYVFHIPFCYGALGRPFAERLSLVESLVGFVALAAVSYLAVWARDTARARWSASEQLSPS